MRLVTFIRRNSESISASVPHVGVLLADRQQILDFFVLLDIPERDFESPASLVEWFDLDGALFMKAKALYKNLLNSEAKDEYPKSAIVYQDDVQLLAPVPRPGKLICIGLNYRDHAAESGMEIPKQPVVFSKFTTSIIGHEQPIILPKSSEKTDYEAELGVVIGRRAKDVKYEEGFDYVFGYTILNDVSERDFQFADGQWQRGKSCDTFAPMGPFIATKDEIPNPHMLSIRLRLNGKTMQNSNTNQLIFNIPALISFLSETITLEPGDVIATGTPPGVGFARNPPVFLKDGELVEVEVEGLGILSNSVTKQNSG